MDKNFPSALALILQHEGGFVHNKYDPGGATNMGVTLDTYRRTVDESATVEDLKQITRAQAGAVYKAQYWNRVQGDTLPSGLDLAVFDMAVNAGPTTAIKLLQRALGVADDGLIGAITLGAVRHCEDISGLIRAYTERRIHYYTGLSTFKHFGKGWTRRAKATQIASLLLVETPHDQSV